MFACFIYFKSLSVFSLRLFRTFLYSLSRNGAMFQTVLTFEPPKLTFSCCDGCGFTSRSLQVGTILFIMLCNILILKCENMERLSRNFQLFSSFRNFQAIFAPLNSYFTEYSRWVPLSFVKIVVFSEDHHIIQDRNGPIINLDASARSASRIFLFHQRFLLFENVYFFSFLFFFFKKWGLCFKLRISWHIFCLSSFSFFFFDRRIYESVNIFSLLLTRLQGYPSIEHLYLADSSLARVGSQKHLSIYDFVFRNFFFLFDPVTV